jgi:hypothetical protein
LRAVPEYPRNTDLKERTMALKGQAREVVAALIETKAVDFEAIGSALASFGPTLALDWDYEDPFCGVNRHFVRLVTPWVVGGDGGLTVQGGSAVSAELTD